MTTLDRETAQLAHAEIRFQETSWEGCVNLDCLPGCSLKTDSWRCERFEQAFRVWLIENRPELVKVAP